MKAVGIDLGTLNSCIGIWEINKTTIIQTTSGENIIPSMVTFKENEMLIGQQAKNLLIQNYKTTVTNSKRLIGRKFKDKEVQEDTKNLYYKIQEDEKGDPLIIIEHEKNIEKIYPEYVSSLILNYLKENAEIYTKSNIYNAVITVPANFDELQRQATIEAAENAGLNVLRIINEPTAAAITYTLKYPNNKNKNVLIFDLGAGTFDVSVVGISNEGIIVVKSTCGNSHLGGEDFDNELKKKCISVFKNKTGIDITNDIKANIRLKIACERAKEDLTNKLETKIEVVSLSKSKNFNMTINREEFNDCCSELFNKIMPKVNEAINDSKLKKNEIDDIVLIGLASRMPKISEILVKNFGKEKVKSMELINPEEAVAYGAAYLAHLIIENKYDDEVVLVDVIGKSIGYEIYGNKMDIIIPKNTTIPLSKTVRFETFYDNQNIIAINIAQGENTKNFYENKFLKCIVIDNIKKAKAGEMQFDVTFRISINCLLSIQVQNLYNGETTFYDLNKELYNY